MNGTADLWNNGLALEPGSKKFSENINKVAKRAIAARKGWKVGARQWNTQRSSVLRGVHAN